MTSPATQKTTTDPSQKKEKETGEETQEAVNCLTAIPKKGEDRKARLPLALSIVRSIPPKKRKLWLTGGQFSECYFKQKREKTRKKNHLLGQSLNRLVATKRNRNRKEGPK